MSKIFEEAVKNNMEETISWFKHLHENPELSFKEYETTKFIIENLKKLSNIEVLTPTETGCIAVLKGKEAGPVIGIRADIDALPVMEETEVDYKSKTDNVMHACGHDVHTSTLLAAATVLNDYADKMKGTIKFIFQPAEELPPGGAIGLVESGALDDCDYIFGAHLMPNIPTGKVAFKSGAIFGASDKFFLTIQGKGGHAAVPNLTVDPVVVAAEIILALQTIVSRKTHPFYNPVISTTVVHTPIGAENVIPDTIELRASIRNNDVQVREETAKWVKQIVDGICMAHGATPDLDYRFGYAPVINDDEAYQLSLAAAKTFMPSDDIMILEDPIQAGEDFGAYSKVAKTSYFLYGGANPDKATNVSPHNPKYKADTDAMYYAIMMFCSLAEDILMK